MTFVSIFSDILNKVTSISINKQINKEPSVEKSIIERCNDLVESNSEAANLVRAQKIIKAYEELDDKGKLKFFLDVLEQFGVDQEALQDEVKKWTKNKNNINSRKLHFLSEPSSQSLLRTLNFAPNATLKLVNMRTDLLKFLKDNKELESLDKDFLHLFYSWFNRGFLELRRVDWTTSADVLEKLIEYESVHEIKGWEDLRKRVGDNDRRLYAYFHPALGSEPLIFVQVALMQDIPSSMSLILDADRQHFDPEQADTAVFYSISNCQVGLRGISFGNFLIKQVVETIRYEFPKLKNFVTLSPIPGFRKWASEELNNPNSILNASELNTIEDLYIHDSKDAITEQINKIENLNYIVAKYLTQAKSTKGGAYDPVAKFHLGNGAELYDIHLFADMTENGLNNSWGCMVNYKYNIDSIEQNHDSYYNEGHIATSDKVIDILKTSEQKLNKVS